MNIKLFDMASLAKQIRTVNVTLKDRGTLIVKILKDSPLPNAADRVLCVYWKNTAVYFPSTVPEAVGHEHVSAIGKLVMDLGGTDGPYNLRQRPGVIIGLDNGSFCELRNQDDPQTAERLAFAHPYLVEWLAGTRDGAGKRLDDCELC